MYNNDHNSTCQKFREKLIFDRKLYIERKIEFNEFWFIIFITSWGGGPCSFVANMLDCYIVVSKFELQMCYYIHFQTNAPWERHEPSYPPAGGGLNSTTAVLLQGWLWH